MEIKSSFDSPAKGGQASGNGRNWSPGASMSQFGNGKNLLPDQNSLNLSTTKQRFSFAKDSRFKDHKT